MAFGLRRAMVLV